MIDSTLLIGDHPIHPDRKKEYSKTIPFIGDNLFISCNKSQLEEYNEKNSVFLHYAINSLEYILRK